MDHARSNELLERHFDNIATPAEQAELEQWLLESDAAREQFWRFAEEAWLVRQALKAPVDEPQPTAAQRPSRSAAWWRKAQQFFARPMPLSFVAAALLLGMTIAVMSFVAPPSGRPMRRPSDEPRDTPIAQLSALHEVVWHDASQSQRPWKVGQWVTTGQRLDLKGGLVELTYATGARVILEGPCDFTVAGGASGTLRHGKITARMEGENKQKFFVQAPFAQITDLGTAFGVAADKSETAVQCLQGRIAVSYARDNVQRVELIAGERLLLGDDNWVQHNPPAGAFPKFARQVPRPTSGSFHTTSWVDNDESPLAVDAKYTHRIDFTRGGDPAEFAGLRFSACALGEGELPGAAVSGIDDASGCRWRVAGYTHVLYESPHFHATGFADASPQRQLLDVSLANINQPRGTANITLYGLTPGRQYELTLFSAVWSGSEPQRIALLSGSEGGQLRWDQQQSAQRIHYRYTASQSTLQLRIAHRTLPTASWHLYAFANAELVRPSPTETPASK